MKQLPKVFHLYLGNSYNVWAPNFSRLQTS